MTPIRDDQREPEVTRTAGCMGDASQAREHAAVLFGQARAGLSLEQGPSLSDDLANLHDADGLPR